MRIEDDEINVDAEENDAYQQLIGQIAFIQNFIAQPGVSDAAAAPMRLELKKLEERRAIAASAAGRRRKAVADAARARLMAAAAAAVAEDEDEDPQPDGQVAENVRRSMLARDERQKAREARNRRAESSAAAAPAGGRQAAGQIVMGRAPPSRASGPRAPAVGANPLQLGGLVEKKLTKEMFYIQRSELPVWALANEGVDPKYHYKQPSFELRALHKSVDGNISRHLRGDPLQQVAAIIAMELATKQPRLAMKFGMVQIPEELGGGPFYSAARAHTPHPNDWGMHSETHLKGLTQSSKSPEQGHLTWFEIFIMGRFPVNFIRNKGGSTSGTADMSSAVKGASDEVVWTWNRIKHRYPRLSGVNVKKELTLKPVATSRDQVPCFQYNSTRSYELLGKQALVACCNKAQLQPFNETVDPSNKAGTRRARANDQPHMHYFGIFSGCRLEHDDEDANPYLPYIEDVEKLGSDDPRGRLLPAIAAVFDEDDTNKGGSGGDVVRSRMLFEKVSGAGRLATMLQLSHRGSDHLDDDLLSNSDLSEGEKRRVQQERDEAEEFFGEFTGMRALFAAVYAFSATPTTGVYDIGSEDMACNEISVRMIEIVPPPGYIGYATEHHLRKNPHCKRHVEVVQLPDPVATHKANMTEGYKHFFLSKLGVDLEEDGMEALPPPFTAASCRGGGKCIRAPAKSKRDDIVAGSQWTAGGVHHAVQELVKQTGIKRKGFWFSDGNNVRHLLEDMEVHRASYPQGYRNVLVITNYTKQGNMLKNWVHTVLGFSGTEMRDGMRCPNGDLTKDLVCIEWFHKYVRFSWVEREVDEDLFHEAVDWLKKEPSDGDCMELWAEGKAFAEELQWCPRPSVDADDSDAMDSGAHRGVSCATQRSNINFAYSVLHKYKELLTARNAARGDPTFLKMMVFTGEIGGRGCNYKTAGKHQFVLTDEFFKFDVKFDGQMTMHAAAAIQVLGRVNTCVADPENAPPIKLWTPRSNWAYCLMWQGAMNELPRYHSLKQLSESYGELMQRIVVDPHGLGCPNIRRMFGSPQAVGRGGKLCWHHLDHQKAKGKQVAEKTHEAAVASDSVPETMLETGELVDNSDEHQASHLAAAMSVVMDRLSSDPDAVDDDDEDEGMDQGLEAALGAPSIGGVISVPQPEPRNFYQDPPLGKGRKRGRAGGGPRGLADPSDYDWRQYDDTESQYAISAIQELHSVGFPAGSDEESRNRFLIELWVHWYIFFLTMPNAGSGPPNSDRVALGDYGHGVHTCNTRKNYVKSVKLLLGPTGRSFFSSFGDLPQSDAAGERERVLKKYSRFQVALNPNLTGPYDHGSHGGSPLGVATKNFYSHMRKWIDLFPPNMDIKGWLISTPAPSRVAPLRWTHEPGGSAASEPGPSQAGPSEDASALSGGDSDDDDEPHAFRARTAA